MHEVFFSSYEISFCACFCSPKIVGIADPRLFARKKLQGRHNVPDENVFDGNR